MRRCGRYLGNIQYFTTNCNSIPRTAGLLYGKLIARQKGVLISFAVLSLSLFAIPHCQTMIQLFVAVSVLGFFCGAYDTAQTVWMLEMWGDESGPFVQAQHFCFALGMSIPSFLTSPFLAKKEQMIKEHGFYSAADTPFQIVGGIAILLTMNEAFLVKCCPYSPPNRKNNTEAGDKDTEIPLNQLSKDNDQTKSEELQRIKTLRIKKIVFVALSGLYLGFYTGMEMCSVQFMPTLVQYGELKLSESQAALVLSGLTGSYAIGRGLGVPISLKVKPEVMISVNIFLVVVSNLLLLAGSDNETFLWLGCITLGLGFSTMYASFCAYMQHYMVFTDMVGAIMLVSGSLVGMAYPALVGNFIEDKPYVLMITNFVSAVLCSLSFGALYVMTKVVS